MRCENVQKKISPLLDRTIGVKERDNVLAHLETCRACGTRLESTQNLRAALRRLEEPVMPEGLSRRVKAIADDARVRTLSVASSPSWMETCRLRAQLFFDNLMRPMALPFAGGLLSALIAFSILVPNLSFIQKLGFDPAIDLVTVPDGKVVGAIGDIPRLVTVGSATSSDGTVVELTIDPKGHVRYYDVIRGELTPDMQSIILFSYFTPATYFGQNTVGKVLVTLRPISRAARS